MLKGFKEFILRGNVVELAVGLVIGLAFTAVVNAVVTAIVKPIVSAAGGTNTNGLGFSLKHTKGVPHGSALDVLGKSTFVDISSVINALIVFLITAAVVYFIFVYPMNKLSERRARGVEPEPETKAEDVLLLEQIRDLLSAQQLPPSTSPGGATTA
jgi:large conductance mechanosensitive channel